MQLPDLDLGGVHPAHTPVDATPKTPVSAPPAKAVEVAVLPSADLDGDRMTGAERAWTAARHGARRVAEEFQRTFTVPDSVASIQPESWKQYRDRVAWVPDGTEGGWLERASAFYHSTVGPFGFAVGHGFAWVMTRPLCLLLVLSVAATAATLWLVFG